MIRALIITAVLSLTGCATKRTTESLSYTELHTHQRVDSIYTQFGRLIYEVTKSDQASAAVIEEDSSYIEFAPSVGAVQVDSTGTITLVGVSRIRTKHRYTAKHEMTATAVIRTDSTHHNTTSTTATAWQATTHAQAHRAKEVEPRGRPSWWVVAGVLLVVLALMARAKK